MSSTLGRTLALTSVLLVATLANAAPKSDKLVWDNGDPNYQNGWNLGSVVVDDFELKSTVHLGSVETFFYEGQRQPQRDFFLKVDDVVLPIASSDFTLASGTLSGFPVYKGAFSFDALTLKKGAHRLEFGSLSRNSDFAWIWTDSFQLGSSTVAGRPEPGYDLTDVAFKLYATSGRPIQPVPEPATGALMLFGLLAMSSRLLSWHSSPLH